MKWWEKALGIVLCVTLLCGVIGEVRAESAADKPAPSVRVLLSRLNLTDRIDLALEGEYLAETKNGTRILVPGGSEMTVQIRDGKLILFLGTYTLDAGTALQLTRQEDEGKSHAFRVLPYEGVYPGDLRLAVSGDRLQPVVTLSVEDYLLGVVPYEMSDSFPMEALKAQAICARTYALYRVNASKEWDLVDTTQDQVFKGILSAHVNAATAVAETAGLVITSNDRLANCYYSASNGGQTELPEHVWKDRERSDCYAVTEDPYDVENPESRVRTARLNRDGSRLPAKFGTQLREAVQALPEMKEFLHTEEAFRIDEISAVQLTAPRYAAPNRLMTKMQITLTVSVRSYMIPETPDPLTYEEDEATAAETAEERTETPAPAESTEAPEETDGPVMPEIAEDQAEASGSAETSETGDTRAEASEPTETPEPELGPFRSAGTFTVTLPLFPDTVQALGLSISGANNEIITVKEEKDAFLLSSGRYGHGVGMSQRGAQWMAGHYGKNFQEILAFYFPGSVIKRAPFGQAVLPTPDPVLAETPGPAATPTPRPTLMPVTADDLPEGAWLASVEKIDDDSSLNLRAEPSASGEILMRLYKHQQLIVLETCEDPVWVHVRTDAIEGYVMVSFLEKVE